MIMGKSITRRAFARSVVAATAIAATGANAVEKILKGTAGSPMGPFYPVDRLAEADADLTLVEGP